MPPNLATRCLGPRRGIGRRRARGRVHRFDYGRGGRARPCLGGCIGRRARRLRRGRPGGHIGRGRRRVCRSPIAIGRRRHCYGW